MKLVFKARVTEVGSNYETEGIEHSGCIIACGGQNLHFELPEGTTAEVATHLFEEVTITVTTAPQRSGKK